MTAIQTTSTQTTSTQTTATQSTSTQTTFRSVTANPEQVISIALSTDENYTQHTAVTMASAIVNKRQHTRLHFYVLTYNVTNESAQRLKSMARENVEVTLIPIRDEDFPNCRVKEGVYWTLPVFFRLRYASFLPELDKVLALDSDMVVTCDLTELWAIDVTDVYVAAVPSGQDPNEVAAYMGLPVIAGVCLNPATSLMNLKKWREDGIETQTFDFLNTWYDRLRFNEEDILNNILQDKRLPLDPKWNVLACAVYSRSPEARKRFAHFHDAMKQPGIIHFDTGSKPWQRNNGHPYKRLYLKYLSYTPWKDQYWRVFRFHVLDGFCARLNFPDRDVIRILGIPILTKWRTVTKEYYESRWVIMGIPVLRKRQDFSSGKETLTVFGSR